MRIFHFTLLLSLLLILCCAPSQAAMRKVLFVGNSYTYTNSMPTMFQSFAAACGDTLTYDMSAPGGYTLQQHSVLPATISKIFAQRWDIVVLQEQSQMPSFPPAQVATDVYPYAARLDSFVHANDTCTQTMFMMTWGRKGGDASNCASYPVVCTYAGMQGRLRESYMQMTQDNDAVVAPVGAAWKIIVDSFPSIDLYIADSSHPSVSGSYLQACVFYASIFHKPSYGCTYLGGLTAATAHTLQRIADKVVLDSLNQWQQYGHYPFAAFTHSQSATAVTFTNKSQKAASYSWTFGDGHTDTAASPSHTYIATGVYTTTLTVENDCFSESRIDTIHVGHTTGIQNTTNQPCPIRVVQHDHGHVTFIMPESMDYNIMEIFDAAGRLIVKRSINGMQLTEELPAGLYVYKTSATGNATTYCNKLVVLP